MISCSRPSTDGLECIADSGKGNKNPGQGAGLAYHERDDHEPENPKNTKSEGVKTRFALVRNHPTVKFWDL